MRKGAQRIQNIVKKYKSRSADYTIREYNVDVMKSLTTIDANILHQSTEGGRPVAVSSIDKTLPSVDDCIHLACIIYGSGSSHTKSPTAVDIACSLYGLCLFRRWREERTHKIEVIIHVCNAYSIPDVCIIL